MGQCAPGPRADRLVPPRCHGHLGARQRLAAVWPARCPSPHPYGRGARRPGACRSWPGRGGDVRVAGIGGGAAVCAGGIFLLPVLSVILVAFAGGVTDRARQVVQAAVSIQAVALGLGLVSWLGALGAHVRQGVWFIFIATDLAVVAAALIFTVAVLRSRALTPQLTDFADDDEDLADDDEDPGGR